MVDGMDDEAYASELFAILTRPLDPDEPVDVYGTGADQIDRYDGFGTEVRVTSIDVVTGQHGAQIEVGYRLAFTGEFDDIPPDGVALLPFDAAWRAEQGFATPSLHAPFVAWDVMNDVRRHVSAHRERPSSHVLPDRAAQWALLLDVMGREGTVAEMAPGRIAVRPPNGRLDFTVLVTPDQWEQVLARYGTRRPRLSQHFSELIASGHRDDRFLVFWDGDLVRSTREQLPPVSGTLRSLLAMRAAGPLPFRSDAGWFAYTPGSRGGDQSQ